MQLDVKRFMEAVGQMSHTTPGFTSQNETQAFLYKELVREEFQELEEAFRNQDVVETADAIADMIFVLIGLCNTLGINFDAVWKEVCRSNLSKIPDTGVILRREDGKVIKPPTFSPPNIPEALGL